MAPHDLTVLATFARFAYWLAPKLVVIESWSPQTFTPFSCRRDPPARSVVGEPVTTTGVRLPPVEKPVAVEYTSGPAPGGSTPTLNS